MMPARQHKNALHGCAPSDERFDLHVVERDPDRLELGVLMVGRVDGTTPLAGFFVSKVAPLLTLIHFPSTSPFAAVRAG